MTGASGFVMIPSPTSPEEDLEECPAPPDSIEELLAGANEPLEIAPPQDSISDQITEILESGAAEDVPRGVSEVVGEGVEEVVSPDDPCPAPAPEMEGPAGAGQHLEFLVSEAKRLLSGSSGRRAPPGLEDRVLHVGLMCAAGRSGARVAEALAGWGGTDLAGVVAKTLPRIAPNVILAKREEVVPLVVAGAGQQVSAGQREVLLGLLFSLMKRPDEEQRAALLGGLGALARVLGPPRLEAELLPRVWDDLAHRRPERRLLVAGAVAALAPHTPASLRNSLLLSMVLQLLAGGPAGERDPQVREAALTSLALLATFMDDTDKLPQLTDVLTQTLASPGPGPTPHQPTATHPSPGLELLAKALLCWGLEAGRLAAVVDPLLDLLAGQVAVPGQGGAAVASTVRLFTGAVLPVLLASLVTSVPGATSQDGTPETHTPAAPALPPPPPCPALEGLQEVLGEGWGGAEAGLALLHTHLAREWLPPWPALDYLAGRVLPGLLGALAGLHAWPGPALDAFLDLFSQLPQCLGPTLTASTLAPLFLARLDGADPEAVRRGATGLTGPMAVVYAVALLGQGGADTAELEGFLARQISILGLCGAPLTAPLLTVASLMAAPRQAEAVLAALWASVVHRAPAVRCAAAGLWGAAVTGAEDGALGPRVVPALVTLAADPEPRVKAATLTPLAAALAAANTPEVVDKVWLQLETLADDPSLADQLDYHLALAHTTTQLAHTGHPRLIHHFLLPRMCRLVVDGAVGARLGAALLEAYSALTCCSLPDHVIVHFVIPPLQQLQKTLGPTSFDHMETITDLLREYSLRAQSSASIDRATRPTDSNQNM